MTGQRADIGELARHLLGKPPEALDEEERRVLSAIAAGTPGVRDASDVADERSTLAAVQAPVIMMSQNRQATKDRLTAALDYETNLRAELEILRLHRKMDGEVIARLARLETMLAENRASG